MKITILGPAHPLRGGIAALNEQLARQLTREGHLVNIVSFSLQYPKLLFPGKTQYSEEKINLPFPVSSEVNSVNPLNWLKTGKKIKKEKPDILIVRFWIPFMAMSLGTICNIVKKNRHTKVISIVDNIIPHEKRRGDRILSNYFVKSADGFIAMSKSVLTDLNNFNSKKPKIYSPHPIYDHYGKIEPRKTALKKLGLSDEFRYVLFFGFIRDYKGLDLLLEAFSDQFFEKNKIKLIVAGEFYTDEASYHKQIVNLNLQKKIILKTEYIPNSEVENYFNAADIVAQPYKSATQSGVTQIGYHFNKPMLVTNVGGLPEIIPDKKAGYVVSPEPEEIKNALIDFFKNNRQTFFTEEVKNEKKRFSWEKMTEAIFNMNSVLQSKN